MAARILVQGDDTCRRPVGHEKETKTDLTQNHKLHTLIANVVECAGEDE